MTRHDEIFCKIASAVCGEPVTTLDGAKDALSDFRNCTPAAIGAVWNAAEIIAAFHAGENECWFSVTHAGFCNGAGANHAGASTGEGSTTKEEK